MSKFTTCKEAQIKPRFSDTNQQHPYDLDYALVEWLGRIKKTYYSKSKPEIMTFNNTKWCVVYVTNGEDDSAYICRDWDTAKALREIYL